MTYNGQIILAMGKRHVLQKNLLLFIHALFSRKIFQNSESYDIDTEGNQTSHFQISGNHR